MTETIIDGETFNIIVEGQPDAPAILLAHSLGTNLHLFDRQVAALKPHFRLVRYDLRGHGASQITPAPYSLAKLGRDALAVLDALKIDKVDLIGASAGGLVSLWLLRHAPERIGRAVLANTAARIGTAENWNEQIRIVTENGVGTLAPSLIENSVHPVLSRAASRRGPPLRGDGRGDERGRLCRRLCRPSRRGPARRPA